MQVFYAFVGKKHTFINFMLLLTYQSTTALITYTSTRCCFLRILKSEFDPIFHLTRQLMDHIYQKCLTFYIKIFLGWKNA